MGPDGLQKSNGLADSNAAFFSGRSDINTALIGGGSSDEGGPLSSSLSPRGRTLNPLEGIKAQPTPMDSPGSDKGSDDSDSQSSNVSSPGMGSPRRVRKEGSPLSASWDTPLSGRSLLKESLIAAESRSNGGFGSPLEHPPGRIQPGGLRLSYDRLLGSGSDSPLGTPKIAKGRERHVDSPKDSPSVSHDFSFSPGGVGSRHAPLMGSPLGMGLSSGGRDSDTMSPLGVTVFKREALHEGDPLIRHGSIKKLGLSIAIPDGTTDQDPPAPKAYETSPRGDVSKATASPLASPTRPKAVAGSPKDKPLSPFADKLSYGAHNPPSSFSTGLTLPTLTRVSSHKARAKVAPEPLRISDEVVRPEDHISGQRVSGDKRAARKDHVMQAIDGDGSKALSGLDSLTMLSRKVGGVKKAGYGESSHEGDVSGEAVTEVVKSKPANSSPWRPLEQGPGGVKPLAAATPKKAKPPQEDADVHTATGQSRNGQDGADVSQEAKNSKHPQKAPREVRDTRLSTRSSRESDDSGADRASTAAHGLPSDRDWTWSDFKVRREVGVGRYSTVYQAEVRSTQFPVALKMYHQKKMDSYVENQVRREIRLHGRVHHKNISEIYGHFEDKDGNICLVLEWAPLGDVFEDRRKSKGPLTEERAVKEVVQPLMLALRYMHKQGIIHRDIKPENILVFPNKLIKLADFGFAIDLNEQRPCTRLGTTDYMAPEIINVDDEHRDREKGNYDTAVDAWAVGILAYELLTGRPPFQSDSRKETYALIRKGDVVIPSYLSTEAASFILTALTRNPHKRPGVVQLLHHPWILTHGVRSHRRSYSHSPVRSRQGSAKGDGPVNTEPIVSSPTAEDGARAKRAPKNRALAGDMLAASHSTNDLSGLSKKAALRAVVGDPISGGKFFGESWEGSGSQPGSPKAGGVDGEGARTPHYMSSLKGVMKNAFSRSKSQKEMASPKSRSGLMSRVTPKGSNSST